MFSYLPTYRLPTYYINIPDLSRHDQSRRRILTVSWFNQFSGGEMERILIKRNG